MTSFVLGRIGNAVFVMVAVSFVAFLAFRFLGDPVTLMLNEQAPQAEREALRERLGLDLPVPVQYGRFLARAVQGDFGISYRTQRDVATLLSERLPATFELIVIAMVLSLVVGIPLGVLAARYDGRPVADAAMVVALVGISLPSFVVALLLVLAFSVGLSWLPAYGRGETTTIGWWSTGLLTPSGRASLVLPAIALASFQVTLTMRLVRAEMLDVLGSDFVTFARARGLPETRILFRHALRNALLPVVTVTGMNVGTLIAFAFVTETVFQWPGLGMLFLQSVAHADAPVMAAYLVMTSFVIVVINSIVDALYAIIDPRIRSPLA